jgi:hypothetical protein
VSSDAEEADADERRHDATSGIPADRAVLDRVVDDRTAVLLVGPGGDELRLPREQLPEGVDDGTWLVLDLHSRPPTVLRIDPDLTEIRTDAIGRRMRRLRRERRGGRFD